MRREVGIALSRDPGAGASAARNAPGHSLPTTRPSRSSVELGASSRHVHELGSRPSSGAPGTGQLHLFEPPPPRRDDPYCVRCDVDTIWIDEPYMVHDEVWAATGLGELDGKLCIECLEKLLGRRLTPADFNEAPCNWDDETPRSARLRSRLAGRSS
jgi:hypothetical protein